MTAPRKYVVGDRVLVGATKIRAELGAVGMVVKVRQDPLPYLVDLGAPWTPAWWSGIDLEPAPEIFAVDPVLTAVREEARKAKVDGDFATVAEHIAAWKRGGRRWARVEGFNVDAWQADEEDKRRATAEAARPMLALAEREVEEALAQAPVASWCDLIDDPRRYARVAPDPVEARFVAMASTLAADPVMAALCGVPAEIGAPSLEELRAANVALMARLERVGAMALGHDDEVCPTCGAARGDR